jgi:hypothetical protein
MKKFFKLRIDVRAIVDMNERGLANNQLASDSFASDNEKNCIFDNWVYSKSDAFAAIKFTYAACIAINTACFSIEFCSFVAADNPYDIA